MRGLWLMLRHPILAYQAARMILTSLRGLSLEGKLERLHQWQIQLDAMKLAAGGGDAELVALLDDNPEGSA